MPRDPRDTVAPTGRFSDELMSQLRSQGDSSKQIVSLLVFTRDGVRMVPLEAGRVVIVGRSDPASVIVEDSSLSRAHARVWLQGSQVVVEDLGSTNGCWHEGKRVPKMTLEVGAELAFGAVPASVQALDAGTGPIGGHDGFLTTLSMELSRAQHFKRGFALLMLRGSASAGPWAGDLRKQLRPFQPSALYSETTIEVLLPEQDEAQARAMAERLCAGAELRCGIALYPRHGSSAGALLEASLKALRRTSPDQHIQLPGRTRRPTTDSSNEPVMLSAASKEVFDTARRLASSTIPVLLSGETGTGKEVLARALHDWGKRAGKSMVCVNCGGIPAQLVESTLFGHERGSFTGATQQGKGVFEAADGGTVLLDEVGELPPAVQAALLRVLESKRFCRVGSTRERQVDVRVIAATHRDLEAMCQAGDFRWDLLYRLNGMTLELPPLRARTEEILPLVERFIAMANRDNELSVEGISPPALALMQRYGWPGNVRELRNAVERAVVITRHPQITVEDLPRRLRELGGAPGPDTPSSPSSPSSPSAAPLDGDLKSTLQGLESQLIRDALKAAGWDRRQAAEALGLPVRTLSHKMKQLGIRAVEPD